MVNVVKDVVDELFELGEPWRSRFLQFIGGFITDWDRREIPSREQVAQWFQNDFTLCLMIAYLLNAWGRYREKEELDKWNI